MHDFVTATTELAGDKYPVARAAQVLVTLLNIRLGTVPSPHDVSAWQVADDELTQARVMLDDMQVPPDVRTDYVGVPEPQTEPRPCYAHKVRIGDQLECDGAVYQLHEPGWCRVTAVGARHVRNVMAPAVLLACGILVLTDDAEQELTVAMRPQDAPTGDAP